MSNRKPAVRVRRIQRAFKQRQRGSLTPAAAMVLLVVLGLLGVISVGISVGLEGKHDEDVYIDRCEHQGGEAVMTPSRKMVCIDRRGLVVPK